ncbi:hypothetical protein GH714_024447 [Hevea brasiliensis]|uniref:VPS9 domain-containing protein n=1 Tax=Hevea brasiliensis TaxID=3981 RepID=A0A6A6KR36_HEVBR|nr:hypothetical protein GH714_024447 [Hevea brasiliensis]
MENADVFLGLHDFLERMRQPSAADFVKSIKSFIVSFSNNAPDPEKDSSMVQEFLAKMEAAFRAHPLWAGCSDEELESAGDMLHLAFFQLQGLEKYVMTKLFTRVFASLPDDVKVDEQLSDKMSLIQQFIRPENLDIKPTFQNETSWLLAQKELQKINMYKAPRDKLVCILNCCKVINNLLLNASIASNENPPGADEFLPVLIYVTIKERDSSIRSKSSETRSGSKDIQYVKDEPSVAKVPSLSDIEDKGALMLLKEDLASVVFREYPYLFAHTGDLTINDVEDLLNNYKQLVFKYVCLSKGLGGATHLFFCPILKFITTMKLKLSKKIRTPEQ